MSGRAVERRPGRGRRDDERGGVALMVAVLTSLLVGVASFAIDLGMARVGVRDMQALADVVALDMARNLDGRSRADILADPAWDESLADSLARNDGTFGVAGTLDVQAEPGVFNAATRTVDTTTGTDIADAVLVTTTTSVNYIFRDGSNTVTRTAIAQASKTACFALGSFAARFRSGDSALLSTLLAPMNAFVRPQANLDVLSYQGLANATVTLNELAADANVGTVDELLTSTVTADRLIRATIGALQRQNDPANTVAITALGKILNGQAELSTPVLLTDVVAIQPTDTAAADTRLNALDLITGAILLADGEHFINVPNLSANIGNLAPISSTLRVIQKAQTACGDDVARTSQLVGEVMMKLQLETLNNVLGAPSVVHTPESMIRLVVNLGNGTGQSAEPGPTCASGTEEDPDLVPVRVGSGLASVQMDSSLHFNIAKLSVPGLGLLGAPALVDVNFDLQATASVPMPAATQDVTLKVPPNDTTPVSVGSSAPLGSFDVASVATNIEATLAGVPLTDVLSLGLVKIALSPITAALATDLRVTGPLNAFATKVNSLLTPLRTLLGLQVSGVDVFAVGRPTCNGSNLRG